MKTYLYTTFVIIAVLAVMIISRPALAADSSSQIDRSQAVEIAMNESGIPEGDLIYTDVEKTTEDGKEVYQVTVCTNEKECSYDIDSQTGDILSAETDMDD